MNLKRMYNTVICGMVALLIIVAMLFWNFHSLISRSRKLNQDGMQLITLSNDMLHVNNYLVKLMRLFMVNHDDALLNEYDSILNDYESLNGKLDKMIEIGLTDVQTNQLNELLAILDLLAEIEGRALDALAQGEAEQARAIIYGSEYANTDSLLAKKTTALISNITDRVNGGVSDIQSMIQSRIVFISIFMVLALSCFITLQIMQRGRVLKPIGELQSIMHRVSTGDTDIRLSKTHNDEIGLLYDDVNGMVSSINQQCRILEKVAAGDLTVEVNARSDKDVMSFAIIKMISDLNETFGAIATSTAQVSGGSAQIAAGTQRLAHGATEQTSAIETLSGSISAMAEQTQENTEMAGRAAALAGAIKDDAQKGSTQMDRMMQAVKEINDASQSISKVIKVIDDIAFQTNILALNASVEAARAGQHGKGFAVVADEVRNLAAKSSAAAKDTSALIANSMEKAELGASIAGQTAESLAGIVTGIGESNDIIIEIAKSSEAQNMTIAQINDGVQRMASIVQQSSAATQQSAAASEQMSGQADLLHSMVAQFKLKDAGNTRRRGPACSSEPRRDLSTAYALSAGVER